eukprot:scaffold44010_cov19-Tisochrysis_lutea.AAC.1
MHLHGQGCDRNLPMAQEWLRKARWVWVWVCACALLSVKAMYAHVFVLVLGGVHESSGDCLNGIECDTGRVNGVYTEKASMTAGVEAAVSKRRKRKEYLCLGCLTLPALMNKGRHRKETRRHGEESASLSDWKNVRGKERKSGSKNN